MWLKDASANCEQLFAPWQLNGAHPLSRRVRQGAMNYRVIFSPEAEEQLLALYIPSAPDFLLVAHCQDGHGIGGNTVAHHIAAVAEVNLPFPVRLRHVLNGAANLRLMSQHIHPLPDGLNGTRRGVRILARQEAIKALHVAQRGRRPDQT